MEVKVQHIDRLLELLGEKTGQPLDHRGFAEMAGQIKGIGEKYLYENLYRKNENAKKKGEAMITMQSTKGDLLAQFLGSKSFRLFVEKLEKRIDPVLLSCVGSYCSYVRRNSEIGVIFCSPVQIFERDGKMWYELRGPTWSFVGELELKNGCLFVLMKATGGKEMHHVYRIGTRERPKVLQGVFSGVSTAFDPIGGRTVLVKMDGKFSELKNEELDIKNLKKSKSLIYRRLAEYFMKYEDNNLSTKKIVNYNVEDLGVSK